MLRVLLATERMRATTVPAHNRGFTLVELLIVLAILSILVGTVIMSIGNVFGRARNTAYITVEHQIQTAAVAYSIGNQGDFPLTGNTTVIDGKTLGIIDACALLVYNSPSGLLREIPDGLVSTTEGDNCDSAEFDCSCVTSAHYVWAMDLDGNVYSTCINTSLNHGGCNNSGQNGFQGVWP